MPRFNLRTILWCFLVVALSVGWRRDHRRLVDANISQLERHRVEIRKIEMKAWSDICEITEHSGDVADQLRQNHNTAIRTLTDRYDAEIHRLKLEARILEHRIKQAIEQFNDPESGIPHVL